jgi:hypothetical protein
MTLTFEGNIPSPSSIFKLSQIILKNHSIPGKDIDKQSAFHFIQPTPKNHLNLVKRTSAFLREKKINRTSVLRNIYMQNLGCVKENLPLKLSSIG